MKLSQAVDGFLLARSADGLSSHTLRDYRHTLTLLTDHLGDPEVKKIDTGDELEAVVSELRFYIPNIYTPRPKYEQSTPSR